MLNFAPEKMMFVAFIAMIVLGPEKLPEMARKMGQIMAELRRVSDGFQQELRDAVNDASGASTVREVVKTSSETVAAAGTDNTSSVTSTVVDESVGDEPVGIVARGPEISAREDDADHTA